ncbi:MAG: PilW family protein [Pseudomonadota bacterium]
MATRYSVNGRNGQSGISLVEVMVAMLIGLILMSGVVQVFTSARLSNRVQDATARMQETGRMALEIISRDARMADFWGCASDVDNVVNHLDTGGTDFIDFGAGGIGGAEGAGLTPDTIVFRGGANVGLGLQPPYGPDTAAGLNIPTGSGLEQEDVVFIADCESADVFQIANTDTDTSGVIAHTTVGSLDPGNVNASDPGCPGANAHCLSKIYGSDATVFLATQVTYSIAVGSEGEPALFRDGDELLDGVEDLQVLFGEDTDGSGTANYFVRADEVVDMGQIVSIRFAVVTRSYEDNLTGGVNQTYTVLGQNFTAPDERLRQVYTTTVNVRNRL